MPPKLRINPAEQALTRARKAPPMSADDLENEATTTFKKMAGSKGLRVNAAEILRAKKGLRINKAEKEAM